MKLLGLAWWSKAARPLLLLLAYGVVDVAMSFRWQGHGRPQGMHLTAKTSYKVTVQHEGKEHVLDVLEDVSILHACLEKGIKLPYDCELGVCLTCPAMIVLGQVDSTGSTLDDSVVAKGYALTCTTYPRSAVTIRSIDEDELINAQFEKAPIKK